MRISSELHISWNARCIWSLDRSAHVAFTVESSRVSFETTWRHGTLRCSTLCTLADVMHCVSFRLRGGSLQSASPITASVIYAMFQERVRGFMSCRLLQTACSFPPQVAIGVRRSVTGSRFFGRVGESRLSQMCPVWISKNMETPLGHRILFLVVVNAIFIGMAVQRERCLRV